MTRQYSVQTHAEEFINITSQAQNLLTESGCGEGMCIVHCPHTTAGITINENADPDVVHDMLFALDKIFCDRKEFRHAEGNSSAHLKASFVGNSICVPFYNGKLLLGIWQGIYFCEFDGPRNRNYFIQILSQDA